MFRNSSSLGLYTKYAFPAACITSNMPSKTSFSILSRETFILSIGYTTTSFINSTNLSCLGLGSSLFTPMVFFNSLTSLSSLSTLLTILYIKPSKYSVLILIKNSSTSFMLVFLPRIFSKSLLSDSSFSYTSSLIVIVLGTILTYVKLVNNGINISMTLTLQLFLSLRLLLKAVEVPNRDPLVHLNNLPLHSLLLSCAVLVFLLFPLK